MTSSAARITAKPSGAYTVNSDQELGGDNLYAEPDAQGVLYSYGNNTSASRSNDWGDNWFDTFAPTTY